MALTLLLTTAQLQTRKPFMTVMAGLAAWPYTTVRQTTSGTKPTIAMTQLACSTFRARPIKGRASPVPMQRSDVQALAPTSRAAQKLAEAGIETQTLQRHLARGEQADDGRKRLYVVDKSSMASTQQMYAFVERLKENDRVLFVGDTRQHEAVEAGRPYGQLQEAGLRTVHLDEIIRQKDPALKEAVEQLARGEVRAAIGNLNQQGRVLEIKDREERITEIAREYVRSPERTLVVSPDNESRREINQHIHRAMQEEGKVSGEEHRVHVFYARQDVTGADRQHAQNYAKGDVLRKEASLGIQAGGVCPRHGHRSRDKHDNGKALRWRRTELRSTAFAGRHRVSGPRTQICSG
jgi:hypothetical protein